MISIIVPIYNAEKYLDECLDSLVNQDVSMDEYEIICIDDGSTDQSGTILDRYAEQYENIKAIHKKNEGVSVARNLGIEMANGDYIWFVDSDDLITHNVLSGINNVLQNKNPDILFVKPLSFNDGYDTTSLKNGNISEDKTTELFCDWLWTRLFKKSIIIDSNIRFNPHIALAEDHMFCTMLNKHIEHTTKYDEGPIVYYYRIRGNSASTTDTMGKFDKIVNSAKAFYDAANNGTINYDVGIIKVCDFMTSIMFLLAKLPKQEANKKICVLNELGIFPLKKQKCFKPEYDLENKSFDDRILLKLKYISYTSTGYKLLRAYRFLLKIKRKLFKR